MHILIRSLTAFVALAFGTTGFSIEKQTEQLHWPTNPRPKLEVRDFYSTFDGIHVPMVSIQQDQFKIELSKRPGFAIRSSGSSVYSAEIRDTEIENVTFTLSVFEKNEFLPDIDENSWLAYKSGLKATDPDSTIVFENTNIESPATPYVFGQTFRQIAYETAASEKKREIFAFVGNKLLVFAVQGSSEAVDQSWGAVDRLISEMSLL